MTLALVPIPLDCLEGSRAHWFSYLKDISERSGDDIGEMQRMLTSGEAQVFLVWNSEQGRAQAFLGVQYVARGTNRVGRLIWLAGEDRKEWLHLIDELETYLREHEHCVVVEPICRPGWSKILKERGYRITHFVMSKELKP